MIRSFFKNMFRDVELEDAKRMILDLNMKLAKIEFTATITRDHERINKSTINAINEIHNDNHPKAFKRDIIDGVNRYLSGWNETKEIMYDHIFKSTGSPFYMLTSKSIDEVNMDSIIRILQQYYTLKIYKDFIDVGNTNTESEFYIEFSNYFKGIECMILEVYPWVHDIKPEAYALTELMNKAMDMYTILENEMLDHSNIIIGRVDKIIKDLSSKNKDQDVHMEYKYDTSINRINKDGYSFEYVIVSYPDDKDLEIPSRVIDAIRGRKSFIHLDSEECIFNLAMIKLIFSYLI